MVLKKIILTTILILGINTNLYSKELWEENKVEEDNFVTALSKEVYSKINKSVEESLQKKAGSPSPSAQYFKQVSYSSCETAKDLVCPPLRTPKFHISRINQINPRTGKITCSVHQNSQTNISSTSSTEYLFNPIATFTFYNKACQQNFEDTTVEDSKIEEISLNAHVTFEETLGNDEFAHTGTIGSINESFGFTDLLDAIAGMNTEIIDFQKTIKLGELTLQEGLILTSDNASMERVKLNTNLNRLRKIANDLAEETNTQFINPFDKPSEVRAAELEKNQILANHDTLFFINVIMGTNEIITQLLLVLAFIAIGWNSLYLGSKLLSNKMNDASPDKSLILSGVFAIFLLSFLASNTTVISIKNEGEKSIKLVQTRVQGYLGFIYQETNSMADDLAKVITTLYLKNMNQKSSVNSVSMIKEVELELEKLFKEGTLLSELDKRCSVQFRLRDISGAYRDLPAVKHQNNIYPFTELEGQKLSKAPYQRFLTPSTLQIINSTSTGYSSFEACSWNKKKLNANAIKISSFEKRIADFNDVDKLEAKRIKLEAINSLAWATYSEYGYWSIAFLPVTKMVQDTLTKLVDKEAEYKYLLLEGDTEVMAKFAAKNSFLLAFFDTSSLQALLKKATAFLPTSWIPFLGDIVGDSLVLAATLIIVDLLNALVDILKIGLFLAIGIYVFTLTFIEKLSVYIISPFSILSALSQRQHERITLIASRVIYVSIKPILYIFAMVLTLFALSVTQHIYSFFMNDFGTIISTSGGWISYIINPLYSAVFDILYHALQFIMIWYLLTSLPKWWAEILEVNTNSLADKMNDTIRHAVSGKMQ
ncbi:MAG: hypothetical protein COA44_04625 [Arcobacter sp.]|nr:MAG: hypothetical protein COA44_04625 [Arcobacter sp.]